MGCDRELPMRHVMCGTFASFVGDIELILRRLLLGMFQYTTCRAIFSRKRKTKDCESVHLMSQ